METECLSKGDRYFSKSTTADLRPVLINSENSFYVKEDLSYGWSHFDPQFINFHIGFLYKRDGTCKAFIQAAHLDWSNQIAEVQGVPEPIAASDLKDWAVDNDFIGMVYATTVNRPTGEKVYKSKILCTDNNKPLFMVIAYPNSETDDRTAILLTTTDPSGDQTNLSNELIQSFQNTIYDKQMTTNHNLVSGIEDLSSDFSDLERTVVSVASAATSRFVAR